MLFILGCLKHHCHLSGDPSLIVKKNGHIRVWGFDLSGMYCTGSQFTFAADDPEGKKCVDSWQVTQQ